MIRQQRMYLCDCGDLLESLETSVSAYECECGEYFGGKSNKCPNCGAECISTNNECCPDCLEPYEPTEAFFCNFCEDWWPDWQCLREHLSEEHPDEIVDFYLNQSEESQTNEVP